MGFAPIKMSPSKALLASFAPLRKGQGKQLPPCPIFQHRWEAGVENVVKVVLMIVLIGFVQMSINFKRDR